MVVDTEGNLLTAAVHSADIQDRVGAEDVLNETNELCPNVTHGWADQSYAGELLEWAAKLLGITIEIVKRPADRQGFVLLPRRWVVERTIAWVNRCRRLSKDFERHTKNSVRGSIGLQFNECCVISHQHPTKNDRTYAKELQWRHDYQLP